jgi:hypothetical protein
MEYQALDGRPVYFAYQDNTKKRHPSVKLGNIVGMYEDRYGVKPVRCLVNAGDAVQILAAGQPELEVNGRTHIESGLFFLEVPGGQ